MNTNEHRSEGSTTITVRVDTSIKKRLDAIAKGAKRSKSFLASEAIEEYLNVQEWQLQGIKEAVASLESGEGIPHASVEKWVSNRKHS